MESEEKQKSKGKDTVPVAVNIQFQE